MLGRMLSAAESQVEKLAVVTQTLGGKAFYDLWLKLIRLQMIEYLVVHLGTFYK